MARFGNGPSRKRTPLACGIALAVGGMGAGPPADGIRGNGGPAVGVWQRYRAALEAGADPDALAGLLAEDVRHVEVGSGRPPSEGRTAAIEQLRARYGPDSRLAGLRWEAARTLVAEPADGALRVLIDGLWGGRLDGRPFRVRFLTLVEIAGGRIRRLRDHVDRGGLGEQVGLHGRIPGLGPPVDATFAGGDGQADGATEADGAALLRRFRTIYATEPFDLDGMAALYATDCRFVDPTSRLDLAGREAVRAMLADARVGRPDGFRDVRWSADETLVDGRRFAHLGRWSGRWRDATFEVDYATVWTIAPDGTIAEHLDFIDMGAWARQVGWTGEAP